MLKKENRRLLFTTAAALLTLLLLSGTLAYWVSATPVTRIISMGRLDGALVEQGASPASIKPGIPVEKIVNVKNNGNVDLLTRVKVEKTWESKSSKANSTADKTMLAADSIKIDTNQQYWMDGGDGYYYYKGILKANETTAQPLFESFMIDKNIDNAYQNMASRIAVTMECIQADGGAIRGWNKTYEQLGIAAPSAPTKVMTKVRFSPDKKFIFDPASTDLFANFITLVPGETSIQTIELTNQYADAVEISLRAKLADATPNTQSKVLMDEVLRSGASLTVADSTGKTLYAGPVLGGMAENIPLGGFAVNQTQNLTITLKMAETLDNRYQNIMEQVEWQLLAKGSGNGDNGGNGPNVIVTLPQTGGANHMVLWLIIFVTAVIASIIVLIALKKMQNKKQ